MGNVKTEVQVLTALVAATGVVAAASAALAPRPWANSSWRRARKPLDDRSFNHSAWEGGAAGCSSSWRRSQLYRASIRQGLREERQCLV